MQCEKHDIVSQGSKRKGKERKEEEEIKGQRMKNPSNKSRMNAESILESTVLFNSDTTALKCPHVLSNCESKV